MNNKKTKFIIVALIMLLGGSYGLSKLFISMKPLPTKKPGIDIKRFVKAETVAYTSIISPLTAKGRVVSSSEVTLIAEASGKVEPGAISLRKGTTFKKGQLLAVIYKDEVELALKARKSVFLVSIITVLTDIKIDFPDDYEVYSNFLNAIDVDKELPALPMCSNSKLKIYLASQNFLSEYYGILQDEKKLSRHSLYAPFNGTLIQVDAEVGGYVNTGGQIAKMIRTDELEVEVPVKNEQSKWIEEGDSVVVYSSNKTLSLTGIVVRKANFIDANTQSRSIFVKVPDTGNDELLTGEYKVIDFPGQRVNGAMFLPRNAVFNSNEVFIVVDGELKKREINILKWNETTLIFNGLNEGDKVVVEPLINANENSQVRIIGEEEEESSVVNEDDKKVSMDKNKQSKAA